MSERTEYMEAKARWLNILQNIFAIVILPWLGWITATVMMHSIALAEIKQWRDSRPKFATKEEMSLAILENEKEMREKMSGKLDAILEKTTQIDKKLAEHLAEGRKP